MKNKHGLIICIAAFIFGLYFMPTIVAVAAVGGLMFAVLTLDDAKQGKKITQMLNEIRAQITQGCELGNLSIEQQQELDLLEELSDDEIEAKYYQYFQELC